MQPNIHEREVLQNLTSVCVSSHVGVVVNLTQNLYKSSTNWG